MTDTPQPPMIKRPDETPCVVCRITTESTWWYRQKTMCRACYVGHLVQRAQNKKTANQTARIHQLACHDMIFPA